MAVHMPVTVRAMWYVAMKEDSVPLDATMETQICISGKAAGMDLVVKWVCHAPSHIQ